jgi:hypothetical protein
MFDVDWRGFGGQDLIPTNPQEFPEGARQPRLIVLATGRKQSTPINHIDHTKFIWKTICSNFNWSPKIQRTVF